MLNFRRAMWITALAAVHALLRWAQKPEDKEEEEEDGSFELKLDTFLHAERQENILHILFSSDSTMSTLLPDMLQKALGGILTHGCGPAKNPTPNGGHELRCYTTAPNWPGVKFPDGALLVRVAKLLQQQLYRILIIQESHCDISNISNLRPDVQLFLSELSAANTLKCAEESLRSHEQLEVVFILGRSPRIDCSKLQNLSDHASEHLATIIEESPLADKIIHCPLSGLEVTSRSQASVLFGNNGDGLHMARSNAARHLYTSAVIRALL